MSEVVFLVAVVAVLSILPPLLLYYLATRPRVVPRLASFGKINALEVVGILFSLNLAFLCNEIWQNREVASSAMARESEALRNLGRIAANIPDRGGMPILVAARQYLEVAIRVDFPAAAAAERAPSTKPQTSSLPALIALSDTLLDGAMLEKMHPAVRTLALTQLATIRDKRLERVTLSDFEADRVKWLALAFLQFMTLVALFFMHAQNARAILVATLIFLLSVNPFVAVLYMSQSPFAGLNPLTSTRLEEARERLVALEAGIKTPK